jgi:hypothetical protein
VATPSVLTWRANNKLRNAAQELRGAVQLARSRAMQEGETVLIDFETDGYFIYVDSNPDKGESNYGRHDDEEPVVRDRQLPAGIELKFKISATGDYVPSAFPTGEHLRWDLERKAMNIAGPWESKAGSLFEVEFVQERKLQFKLEGAYPNNHNYSIWYKGEELKTMIVQHKWAYNKLIFDGNGQCLTPQFILMVNVKGHKMLLEVTRHGIAKVTKVDDDFADGAG